MYFVLCTACKSHVNEKPDFPNPGKRMPVNTADFLFFFNWDSNGGFYKRESVSQRLGELISEAAAWHDEKKSHYSSSYPN